MVLSTTETIAGKEIKEVLGIARGSTVRTRNAGRDIIAMLKGIGVDGKYLRMVYKLYRNQKAAVRIGTDQNDWMDIKRGVRQGCFFHQICSHYTVK